MFANLASKISDKSITAADIWGATAASSIGSSREIKSTRKVDDCDVLDKYAPSVKGYIVKAQRSTNLANNMDVTIAVSTVLIDPACKHVKKLPSGDVIAAITTKLKTTEIKAMPHVFADGTGIVSINGVIRVSINTKNAGPNETDLSVTHLPMATEVTLHKVAFHTSVSKVKGTIGVYGNAERIEISPVVISKSEVERDDLLFQKIATECPGVGLQSARGMMSHIGTHLQQLDNLLIQDAMELKAMFSNILETLQTHKIGVQQTHEQPVLTEDAKTTMNGVVNNLSSFIAGNEGDGIYSLHQMMAFDASTFQSVAIVGSGMMPAFAKAMEVFSNGLGCISTGICMYPNDVPSCVNVVGDALIVPSESMMARSEVDKKTKALTKFSIDVSAFSVAMRTGSADPPFAFFLPKLDSGEAVAPRTFKMSPKKDKLGVYDFYRTQMVFNELIKYANVIMFAEFQPTPVPFLTDRQPAVKDSDWASANYTENVVGMAGAISRVGIRVDEAFVREYVVDENGMVECIPNWQQIGEENKDKTGFEPPKPPSLELHGMWAVNGVADQNYASRIKRAVNKDLEFRFYAVYEKCAEDVADSPNLNADPSAGAEHMKIKFADNVVNAIKESVALYAVAFSCNFSSPSYRANKRRAVDASSDEDDEAAHSSKQAK